MCKVCNQLPISSNPFLSLCVAELQASQLTLGLFLKALVLSVTGLQTSSTSSLWRHTQMQRWVLEWDCSVAECSTALVLPVQNASQAAICASCISRPAHTVSMSSCSTSSSQGLLLAGFMGQAIALMNPSTPCCCCCCCKCWSSAGAAAGHPDSARPSQVVRQRHGNSLGNQQGKRTLLGRHQRQPQRPAVKSA